MAAQSQDPEPDSPGSYMHNHRRGAAERSSRPAPGHARGGTASTPPSPPPSSPQPILSSSLPPHLSSPLQLSVCFFHSAPLPLPASSLPCCCLSASPPAHPHPNIHPLPIPHLQPLLSSPSSLLSHPLHLPASAYLPPVFKLCLS